MMVDLSIVVCFIPKFTYIILLLADKIKQYAAYSIKKHINDKNTYGSRRYDWEIISDKDYSADLLSFIADYLLSNNDIEKFICASKILKTIEKMYFVKKAPSIP